MFLPLGVMGLSEIYDCGISRSYSLAFCIVISLKLYQNKDIARQRFR